MSDNWKKLRRNLQLALLVAAAIAAFLGGWVDGIPGAMVAVATLLCLALGFWLTEGLVGVMTGIKKANGTAIGLLFLGKLLWWGSIFWLSRQYPPGTESSIAVGLGAFLLALLIASIGHFGWPKISDAQTPGEP
jgi:hypothetical protein